MAFTNLHVSEFDNLATTQSGDAAVAAYPADGNLANLGQGGRTIRERAKAWLEQAGGGAPLDKLIAENEKLKAEAEVTANTIGAMQAQLAKLEKLMAASAGVGE